MRFKRLAEHYVWCDYHGSIHEATENYFDDSGNDMDGLLGCRRANWRRVYVETNDREETF